ncbi:MAG: carboxypeptidase regulatory-like domain-containing protein [Planctomycetota bacterium]
MSSHVTRNLFLIAGTLVGAAVPITMMVSDEIEPMARPIRFAVEPLEPVSEPTAIAEPMSPLASRTDSGDARRILPVAAPSAENVQTIAQPTTGDFEPTEPMSPRLRGQIVSTSGEAITGARVVIRSEGRTEPLSMSSDASGQFATDGDGPFSIQVCHPDWRATTRDGILASDHVIITLDAGAAVTGSIRSEAGQPIEGATISLVPMRPDQLLDLERSANTDDEGQFELRGLLSGNVRLKVEAEGYADLVQDLQVGDSGETSVAWQLTWSEQLLGQVVDESGAAISGATVHLRSRSGELALTSDMAGHFTAENVCANGLSVWVTARGFSSTRLEEVRTDEPLTVVLRASLPACGRVVDQRSGAPIAGARVRLSNESRSWRTTTDATGRFEVSGAAGNELQLEVTADGYRPEEPKEVSTTSLIEVELRPGATVTGRVLGPDGAPLANVSVCLVRAGSETDAPKLRFGSDRLATVAAGRTNGEGRYELDGVADGEYWLLLAHGQYRSDRSERVLVANGLAGAEIASRLQAGLALEGRVLHEGQAANRGYVRLLDADGKTVRRVRLTPEGHYATAGLAPGRYHLLAEKTGSPVAGIDLDLNADRRVDLGN